MKNRVSSTKTPTKRPKAKRLPSSIVLRGRTFTTNELKIIKRTTSSLFSAGRYKISLEICRLLNWTQPNGWLKDRACRDVLRTLDAKNYICLPKPKVQQSHK